MWYSENIGTIPTARPFKYEGISYPATTFKQPTILAEATIYPMRVEKVDTKYYTQGAMTRTFADGMWVESYEAVPKDLEVLKKELVREYLNRLDTTLSRTDKFLTRSDEMAQWFSKWTDQPLASDVEGRGLPLVQYTYEQHYRGSDVRRTQDG